MDEIPSSSSIQTDTDKSKRSSQSTSVIEVNETNFNDKLNELPVVKSTKPDNHSIDEHPVKHQTKNPFLSLFGHLGHTSSNNNTMQHTTGHNTLHPSQSHVLMSNLPIQSDSCLIDYSSEALLQYCRDGKLNSVKEILRYYEMHNNNTQLTTNKNNLTIFSRPKFDPSSNYNTISGDASTIPTMLSMKKIKIDIEFHDEVNRILFAKFCLFTAILS